MKDNGNSVTPSNTEGVSVVADVFILPASTDTNTDFVGESLLHFLSTPKEWQRPRVNGCITVYEPALSFITEEYGSALSVTNEMYFQFKYTIG